QLLAFQDDDGGFIELTPQGLQLNKSILLRKRDVELQFPAGTDVLWLAALLRAL
ncbi:IS66 family insertion sequence element accessory protein TnpA, partial [Acinetobacter baumannii]|nr:IS66 family insertion sequence element accessory protein TnpB [Acinetobacter baumannii]